MQLRLCSIGSELIRCKNSLPLALTVSILVAFVYIATSPHLLLRIFQRRHLLNDSRRYTHSDAPSGDVLRHDRTRCDCTALANGNTRQNHRVSTNPTIVADDYRLRVLDVVAPRLHLRLVCSSHDGHVGAKHDRLANRDKAAIQDCKVEVRVEAVSRLSALVAQLFFLLALTGRLR